MIRPRDTPAGRSATAAERQRFDGEGQGEQEALFHTSDEADTEQHAGDERV